MRNKLVAAAITGLVAAPGAHAAADVSWFGFNQITASTTSAGVDAEGDDIGGGLAFDADRIRIGYKAKFDNNAFSKLQVDFLKANSGTGGGNNMPGIIKDATVGYDFGPANVQAGQRKTPVGMDYNTSGKKLDIVDRGMEKDYVTERAAGLFVFGNAGPVGYAVGLHNPTTRSGAVPATDSAGATATSAGEDLSFSGRVSYGMGKMLHAELSYGTTPTHLDNDTGTGAAMEDYSVMDIGLKSQPMPGLTLKAEYLSASNVGFADGRDQTVWYVHGGYEFTPMMEGVLRHYSSTAENDAGLDDTLGNTFLGLNVFLNPEKHHEARIQLNYILPSGDTDGALGAHRNRANVDDSGEATGKFKAMFQTAF